MANLQRREFLTALLATAGWGLGGCRAPAPPQTRQRVIIVGAGMAGISAGRKLQDNGHHVTVLEGRDRLGGRMWTSRVWEDVPVDLGASWIHGPIGNPLTRIADEAGALRRATDSETFPVYGVTGKRLPESVWDEVEDYASQVQRALRRVQRSSEDRSLWDAIQAAIPLDTFSARDRRRLHFAINNLIEQEFAADVAELSAQFIEESESFRGEDVVLPEGYDALPRHLARDLTIRYRERVLGIEYSDREVVVTTDSDRYVADRVIVTLPLGVLKNRDVAFTPELPAAKRTAIEALGLGVMNKLALRFESAFWETEADWIGYVSEEKGQFSNWLSFQRSAGHPVLVAFNVGQYGRAVESRSDEDLVAEAMGTLKRMYGSKLTVLKDVQATRWQSDPFARCSYSSPAVGMGANTRSDLAAPLADRVFFAGEATSESYPATVHGAYLSGQREADRIIQVAQQAARTMGALRLRRECEVV